MYRCAIVVGEGLSRLGVVMNVLPFPYLIRFSQWKGVQKLDVLCGPLSKVVHLCSWTWVLPFCSLYSPLFERFGSFLIDRVSSSSLATNSKSNVVVIWRVKKIFSLVSGD